jgi:NitT/TauT family transport system substrate-binding protein
LITTTQARRRFLAGLSGVGIAALLREPALAAGERLDTTSVRLPAAGSICMAPQHLVTELLRAEGFTDIRLVPHGPDVTVPDQIAQGAIDFGGNYASTLVSGIDRGVAMKTLAGVHVGCFELFVKDTMRSVAELAGKKVGIRAVGSTEHLFLSVIAANVGIDPRRRSTGSPAAPKSARSSCLSTARLTHSSAFRRTHRSCAPRASAMSSSTARSIALGRNISAAC